MFINSSDIPSYTWGTLPTEAQWPVRDPVFVTDVGGGSYWYRHSGFWRPIGGQILLQQSGSPVVSNVAGDQTSSTGTQRAVVPIPGGLLGANGQLVVEALWSFNESASAKLLRVRFGSGDLNTNLVMSVSAASAKTASTISKIINGGATGAQKISNFSSATGFGTTTANLTLLTVDTSALVNVYIGGQFSSAGDEITLQSYSVYARPQP